MKVMIASDIHGSAYWCRKLMEAMEKEQPKVLLLLGDLLYHGPRNALPEEYDPQEVARMLNEKKESLLCVRGNCEAEVDQLMLEFPVLADYAVLYTEAGMIFATHGHHYNIEIMPPLAKGSILLYGHTHVPLFEQNHGIWCVNPGSVSIPKADSAHSYLIIEEKTLTWKDLNADNAATRTETWKPSELM